jgi:hypothetical protein
MVLNRQTVLLSAPFLASGTALVVYTLAGLSLLWTFIGVAGLGMIVFAATLCRMKFSDRRLLLRVIAIGAISGLTATIAYDLVRLLLVELGNLNIRPFETWRLFGIGLIGADQSQTAIMAAGTFFHFFNGIAFGISYTIAFGRRGPLAGIVWALILEAIMVSLYPSWLDLKALDEFLSVSIFGHVVYGSVLGWQSKRLLGSYPSGAIEGVAESGPGGPHAAD